MVAVSVEPILRQPSPWAGRQWRAMALADQHQGPAKIVRASSALPGRRHRSPQFRGFRSPAHDPNAKRRGGKAPPAAERGQARTPPARCERDVSSPKAPGPGRHPPMRQENLTACARIKPQSFARANRNLHTPFRKPRGRPGRRNTPPCKTFDRDEDHALEH